jgi:hypothetical protein
MARLSPADGQGHGLDEQLDLAVELEKSIAPHADHVVVVCRVGIAFEAEAFGIKVLDGDGNGFGKMASALTLQNPLKSLRAQLDAVDSLTVGRHGRMPVLCGESKGKYPALQVGAGRLRGEMVK